MVNYRPKHRVKVDGKMSEEGADRAGNKFANAVLIFSVLAGLSLVITAVAYLLK